LNPFKREGVGGEQRGEGADDIVALVVTTEDDREDVQVNPAGVVHLAANIYDKFVSSKSS
jgi:hypothetical protein